MLRKLLVTCPETSRSEEIEYLNHPLGVLIARCTAFGDGCRIRCERACAARLDRRQARSANDPRVGTVLCVRSCLRD
jgi:hypothetical protein